MRHAISGNKLGRHSSWRKATVRDIAKAALIRQRICTTKAKAKEARKLVDRLITLGKKGTLAHRRRAFSILCEHKLVSELFDKTAPRFKDRNGGYTRIIPLSSRKGDNAQMAFLELTEKDEVVISKAKSSAAKKKKTREAVAEKQSEVKGEKAADIQDIPQKETQKSDQIKKIAPKHGKDKEQSKSSQQKIVGGIKKIFRRKTAE